jgi:CRISPR-associated exonuclease Cas4
MISALEHWSYCPRQCALIHLEQTYDENLYTLRGNRVHAAAHDPGVETDDGVRVVRGLPLWSDRLGLIGKADIVEWYDGVPYPVEYKSGKRRNWVHEVIQLCAQAICLEEMLGVAVPRGAIYYHASRRRLETAFTGEQREAVAHATADIRKMIRGDRLPAAYDDARCPNCSLLDACLPKTANQPARIRAFHQELFNPVEPAGPERGTL